MEDGVKDFETTLYKFNNISRTFFRQFSFVKNIQPQTVSAKKLHGYLLYIL